MSNIKMKMNKVRKRSAALVYLLLCFSLINGQTLLDTSFTVVPLGVKGGSDESNLSSYMISRYNSNRYILMDASTIHAGIQKAIQLKSLKGDVTTILRENITGYFISHPHLDHLAGMIINSPDDTNKPIYGLPFCLTAIRDKYFSWKTWANFGDTGEEPKLKKYNYVEMTPGIPVITEAAAFEVSAFPLSHSAPYESTAFLIKNNNSYLLYLGDTGADEVEKSNNLDQLWIKIGPLIKQHLLKAIFIEVSFANDQKRELLFGHLTPMLLMEEMKKLSVFAGQENMKNLNVVITHQKPAPGREARISSELKAGNSLQLNLVFPKQGFALNF